jgi:hypothetical protein
VLTFRDGTPFTTSTTPYRAAHDGIRIPIAVEGFGVEAIVDTGAPYLICEPELAEQIDFSRFSEEGSAQLRTHLGTIRGKLYRVELRLLAEEGGPIALQVTAYVPERDRWGNNPTFLGFQGCLERFRFAVDPSSEQFYFGLY